jgi:hypothetical protein
MINYTLNKTRNNSKEIDNINENKKDDNILRINADYILEN